MSSGPRQVVGRKRCGKARGKAIIVYFLETHFNSREWATNPGYRTPRPARRVQGCGGAVVGAPAGTLRFPSSCHARNGSKTEVERKGIVSASLVRQRGADFGGPSASLAGPRLRPRHRHFMAKSLHLLG